MRIERCTPHIPPHTAEGTRLPPYKKVTAAQGPALCRNLKILQEELNVNIFLLIFDKYLLNWILSGGPDALRKDIAHACGS